MHRNLARVRIRIRVRKGPQLCDLPEVNLGIRLGYGVLTATHTHPILLPFARTQTE